MIRVHSPFGKAISVVATFSILLASVPAVAVVDASKSMQKWWKQSQPKPAPKLAKSRLLGSAQMKSLQGRSGENPYAAGQAKWDVVYKGVNLMTGSYSTEATDLSFEGGYGIPVNVTRAYNSNNGEEGPLGKGWTLSVDVRSTAGGLIKSSAAPVRAVPVNFKERPSAQVDPNAVTADGSLVQPVQAVLATDAAGTEETIQRDADGILSTPPWDKNKIESEYETQVMPDGTNIQVMTKNYVNTPDGTVYVYEKQGAYVNGVRPFDNPTAAPEVSNVLKIASATDRHGNITTYTYDQTKWVTFKKVNGTVQERPLKEIQMPNGHIIRFTWTGNRLVSAAEVGGINPRTVQYGYNAAGMLTSVTTPGGKVTQYGYANPYTAGYTGPSASNILSSITDPRGLTTYIYSAMSQYADGESLVVTFKLKFPNGMSTYLRPRYAYYSGYSGGRDYGSGEPVPTVSIYNNFGQFFDFKESTGQVIAMAGLISGYAGDGTYTVRKYDSPYWDLEYEDLLQGQDSGAFFTYDATTQNLMESIDWSKTSPRYEYPDPTIDATIEDGFQRLLTRDEVRTLSTYNFMGNPLEQSTTITRNVAGQNTGTFSTSASYAYWGAEKYYQRKATKDQAGRYSYTDYYDASAPVGKKGQTYKVYDDKRTTFVENPGIPIPVSVPPCPTGKYWKYRLAPQADTYSAMFDYDAKGRPLKVWKLQSTATSPWTYVRTDTTYGADQAPAWGAATTVVEDAGGLNRTTETLAYDNSGRAVHVRDGAGQEFYTDYDADGVIQAVRRGGPGGTPLVMYSYGTSGLLNGMVLGITDGLSGVTQSFAYAVSGAGLGQVSSVTETNGSDTYSTSYTYNAYGDRATAAYSTQSALGVPHLTVWRYDAYRTYGDSFSPTRQFRRLTRLDPATGQPTPEEFDYNYDSEGRLLAATFAQTPDPTVTAPLSNGSWYSDAKPATTRGRAWYEYTMQGQLGRLNHWWDTRSGGSYTSNFVRGNEAAYETTGMKRGLKTASAYLIPQSGNPTGWQTQRTETYSYDSDLDYLVGANYGDGLPNQSVTWGYDAAGNRISDSSQPGAWTYDNLNRMLTSPGKTYGNDILGNRTLSNGVSMSWDNVGRMATYGNGPSMRSYDYRADGMRVRKSSLNHATQYRYDGQMGIEDVEWDTGSVNITRITRYGLGARGIDVVSTSGTGGSGVTYPLYDTHGNNVGSLTKSGSSFTVSDEYGYDAWGGIRSGVAGDGKSRYCANIGHKQDDESGLIYMRARYYEPTSGRFVSEDASMDGRNWYVYCANNPIMGVDPDGNKPVWDLSKWYGEVGGVAYAVTVLMTFIAVAQVYAGNTASARACMAFASAAAALSLLGTSVDNDLKAISTVVRFVLQNQVITGIINAFASGIEEARRLSFVNTALIIGWSIHTMSIIGALASIYLEEEERQ